MSYNVQNLTNAGKGRKPGSKNKVKLNFTSVMNGKLNDVSDEIIKKIVDGLVADLEHEDPKVRQEAYKIFLNKFYVSAEKDVEVEEQEEVRIQSKEEFDKMLELAKQKAKELSSNENTNS